MLKRLFLLLPIVLLLLTSCDKASTATNTTQSIPTATKAPISTQSAKPTPTTAQQQAIQATSGRPHLGGPISDFYGKYGKPVGDAKPDSTIWYLEDNTTDIGVHYDASSMAINYITYAGPSGWTKEQYKQFLLTFAPDGTSEDTQTNQQWKDQGGDVYDPIAYTSPSVSKFFLHISDTSGYANIV